MGRKKDKESEYNYEDIEFYHGLLPREDLPYLLQEKGDCLVRVSETKQGAERQLILSVCLNPGTSVETRELKHIVIFKRPGGYCLDNRRSENTVKELIDYFVTNSESVIINGNVLIHNPIVRQPWELKHEDVVLERKLGEGAFGEVHAGKLTLLSKRKVNVAIKLAKTTEMTKEKIKEMMKEARLMRNLEHPNIVRLYGVAVEHEPLMIVMELINGGALDEYLRKNKAMISGAEKLDVMVSGAAFGLEYLHSKNVIHRDIAARNCLFADGNIVKISDFGLSREGDQYALKQARRVPIKWLAPETINTLIYTQKTDVWTFGILVYEIYTAQEPYQGMPNAEVKEKIITGYKMPFPEDTPPEVVELVCENCWAMQPDQRYSMTQVVQKLCAITGITPPVPSSNMSNVASGGGEKKHKKKGLNSSQKKMKKDENCNIGAESTKTRKSKKKKF